MIDTIPQPATPVTLPLRSIARHLLSIGAVKFNVEEPFTWTSGIKSPIYCDSRMINSNVDARGDVIDAFTHVISGRFRAGKDIDIIAGIATGGISYGALIADRMRMPFIYIRSERKAHGLKKMVEGGFRKTDRIILIEDLISTGISSMNAVDSLRDEGMEIVHLYSIMTYDLPKAEERYREAGIQHDSLCNLTTVLEVALEDNILNADQVAAIKDFSGSPETWRK